MSAKVLFPISIIALTLCLSAVVFGFIVPMTQAYHFNQWQELNSEAQRATMQTRLDDAERSYRQALSEARQSGSHRRQEAETLTLFGDVLRKEEKYSEAENNFQSAAKILESEIASPPKVEHSQSPNERAANLQIQLSNTLSRLAITLDAQGKTEDATTLRERILHIYKNISTIHTIPGDSVMLSEQMVRNYGKLAEHALNAGKLDEARRFYTDAMQIEMKCYVPEEVWLPIRTDCLRLLKASAVENDPLALMIEKEQVTPFSSK